MGKAFKMARCFFWGFRDVFDQGGALQSGLTFDDDPTSPRSEAYDRGATLAEGLFKLFQAVRHG